MKLRHQNDILQAIVVPRRGARPGRSPSSLLPRPHWLPSQRLLWTQWGDSASTKFWQICCVHVLINICCRCWVVSVHFERTSQWSSSPPATREWDLVRKLDKSAYPITFTPSEQSFERVLLEGLRMYLLDLKHWHCIAQWGSEEDENNLGEVFWHKD